MSRERFVSEPIEVDAASMSAAELARGAPSCPRRFTWRGQTHTVTEVLDAGRQVNDEGYVRSHSFRVRTDQRLEVVLRCDRHPRGKRAWRIFTVRKLEG